MSSGMADLTVSWNSTGKEYQPSQWGGIAEDQLCSTSVISTSSPVYQVLQSPFLRAPMSSGTAALIVMWNSAGKGYQPSQWGSTA